MDSVTRSKFMGTLDLIQRRAKADKEALQLEKVRWIDDSSESDWIVATELQRKQLLMPLEAATGWKAPVEVLRHFAERQHGGLEAKSTNGMSFYDLILGSPVLGYNAFAKTFGTFQPRQDQKKYYKVVGLKVHASETCLVIFAVDVLSDRRVALKLMVHEDQWHREIDLRKTEHGEQVDTTHVMELVDYVELDVAGLEYCRNDERLQGEGVFRYLLVMPQATRDLSDLLSHDRVAGHKLDEAKTILKQVADHLHYLHEECRMIHGDIKSRNIVEVVQEDGDIVWALIDLDALLLARLPVRKSLRTLSFLQSWRGTN